MTGSFALLQAKLAKHPNRECGTGATASEITAAAQVLGLQLKGGHREFLSAFGWGGFNDVEVFGLGHGVPPYLDLVRVAQSERIEARPPLPPTLIPLSNDGGGNLYCLDATDPFREEYPVVFWDHERPPDQEPEFVASSFVEWLLVRMDEPEAGSL